MTLHKLKWRIFYEDYSTYDSSSDPFYARPYGAIVVAVEDEKAERGWLLAMGKEAFYWKDGRWWACDDRGLDDYLMMFIGPKAVLFGRNLRDELYWDIVKKANKEGIDGC